MIRREFLKALSALPLLGWLGPQPQQVQSRPPFIGPLAQLKAKLRLDADGRGPYCSVSWKDERFHGMSLLAEGDVLYVSKLPDFHVHNLTARYVMLETSSDGKEWSWFGFIDPLSTRKIGSQSDGFVFYAKMVRSNVNFLRANLVPETLHREELVLKDPNEGEL